MMKVKLEYIGGKINVTDLEGTGKNPVVPEGMSQRFREYFEEMKFVYGKHMRGMESFDLTPVGKLEIELKLESIKD